MSLSVASSAARLVDPRLAPPEREPAAKAPGERPAPGGAVASTAPVAGRGPADPLGMRGLPACIDEARATAVSRKQPPPEPASFAVLRQRLAAALPKLQPPYRAAVGEPLVKLLDRLGAGGYASVLARDPEREGTAGLLLDVAQAVLQQGEAFGGRATAAFQEVVSDLYDGFVAAEGRKGVRPPDAGTLPPLVRWGSSETGPYTWPAPATAELGVKAGVVSLPIANAEGGLLAWPALAHETAGHDILEADDGLSRQLATAVTDQLAREGVDPAIASYWSQRIDETAADVLGVLNMGPAAAVGLVGYFRALNGAYRGTAALRNVGRADDPHPADIARGWLAAETVRLLSFEGAGRWAERLTTEIDRDLGKVWLGGAQVSAGAARASAAAVARAIVQTRLPALEGRSLGEIQGWTDADEAVVAALRPQLASGAAGQRAGSGPGKYAQGAYAAHAVAAGVYEAVAGGTPPARVTGNLVAMLDAMHAANPAWREPAKQGRTPARPAAAALGAVA